MTKRKKWKEIDYTDERFINTQAMNYSNTQDPFRTHLGQLNKLIASWFYKRVNHWKWPLDWDSDYEDILALAMVWYAVQLESQSINGHDDEHVYDNHASDCTESGYSEQHTVILENFRTELYRYLDRHYQQTCKTGYRAKETGMDDIAPYQDYTDLLADIDGDLTDPVDVG